MPIAIGIDPITGLPKCPCCRLSLHHCKKCWNEFHNSHNGEDYIPPEYFGQSFFSEEVVEKINKDLGRKPKVKQDKSREYIEGDYVHEAMMLAINKSEKLTTLTRRNKNG